MMEETRLLNADLRQLEDRPSSAAVPLQVTAVRTAHSGIHADRAGTVGSRPSPSVIVVIACNHMLSSMLSRSSVNGLRWMDYYNVHCAAIDDVSLAAGIRAGCP
jgi:hypothetical protein